MKKVLFRMICTLCALCLLCGCGSRLQVEKKDVLIDEDTVRVMTFNVCGWNHKNLKHLASKTILTYEPDVVGLQECTYDFYKEFSKDLPGYSFVGVGRENGKLDKKSGENCGILYKTEKYTLVDSGTFWLSATPEQVSLGWDADYLRICTWVVLKNNETGEEFAHVNTHIENVDDGSGFEAQEKGIALALDKALSWDMPVVMTGDFNIEKDNAHYETILTAGFRDTQDAAANTMDSYTFHGFEETDPPEHIDYVFVSEAVSEVITYKVVQDLVDGQYPSDHYPIYADLKF